jgi:hypothetical protein
VDFAEQITEHPERIDGALFGSLVGCFRSRAEFEQFVHHKGGVAVSQWLIEKNLRHSGLFQGRIAGWSELVGGPTFYSFHIQPDSEAIDLREQLVCAITGLSARVRFCASLALRLLAKPKQADVYITEQVTLAFRWFKERFPKLKGSEYFDEESKADLQAALRLLDVANETLHFEDITQLTFRESTFDAVISLDVLEHVPAYLAALSEFFRILRPGGTLIVTIPFMQDSEKTKIRALMDADGSITHIEEPDYHGDPVREGGVLCFQDFGWDLLQVTRQCGFSDALMALPWDYTQGLMGPLWTLVARK